MKYRKKNERTNTDQRKQQIQRTHTYTYIHFAIVTLIWRKQRVREAIDWIQSSRHTYSVHVRMQMLIHVHILLLGKMYVTFPDAYHRKWSIFIIHFHHRDESIYENFELIETRKKTIKSGIQIKSQFLTITQHLTEIHTYLHKWRPTTHGLLFHTLLNFLFSIS